MKDERESDSKPLTRIMVLGATFFMVALCPAVDMALAVFGSGIVIYLLLWRLYPYEKKKK